MRHLTLVLAVGALLVQAGALQADGMVCTSPLGLPPSNGGTTINNPFTGGGASHPVMTITRAQPTTPRIPSVPGLQYRPGQNTGGGGYQFGPAYGGGYAGQQFPNQAVGYGRQYSGRNNALPANLPHPVRTTTPLPQGWVAQVGNGAFLSTLELVADALAPYQATGNYPTVKVIATATDSEYTLTLKSGSIFTVTDYKGKRISLTGKPADDKIAVTVEVNGVPSGEPQTLAPDRSAFETLLGTALPAIDPSGSKAVTQVGALVLAGA